MLDGGGLARAVYDLKRQLADIEVKLEEAEARRRRKQQSGRETTTTRDKAIIPDKKDKNDSVLSSSTAVATDSAASVWQLAEYGREQVLTARRYFTSKMPLNGRHQDGVSSFSLTASASTPVPIPVLTPSSLAPSSAPCKNGKEDENVEKQLPLRQGRLADRVTGWFRRVWGSGGSRGTKSGKDSN